MGQYGLTGQEMSARKGVALLGACKGDRAHRHLLDVVISLGGSQRASPVLGVGHDDAGLAASPLPRYVVGRWMGRLEGTRA
jgi:hypothetical protein